MVKIRKCIIHFIIYTNTKVGVLFVSKTNDGSRSKEHGLQLHKKEKNAIVSPLIFFNGFAQWFHGQQ